MTRLDSNRFKREQLKIAANKYELRHGLHHLYPMTEPNVYHKSSIAMIVYFLQNDAGFLKWGPTPERMEQLAEAFEIGKDKEVSSISHSSLLNVCALAFIAITTAHAKHQNGCQ